MLDFEECEDEPQEDWRIDAIESGVGSEERKANYSDPQVRRERALEFINRTGSAWERLKARAEYAVREGKYFKFDYEVETMKRAYADLGYAPSEIRDMFNNCNASTSGFLTRELALAVPGLYPEHMRLRRCKAANADERYKPLAKHEGSAYMGFNSEEIGE